MAFDPQAVADGGPVVILLVGISFLAWGFVRGYIVPGWLYKDERDSRRISDTQATRNADALASLAKDYATLASLASDAHEQIRRNRSSDDPA